MTPREAGLDSKGRSLGKKSSSMALEARSMGIETILLVTWAEMSCCRFLIGREPNEICPAGF